MKAETRKDEIIKTAAKLFKEKGYSAVTMRDLATAMGIKAASLYNHINSKQEILKEIIISLAEEFTDGMEIIKALNESSLNKLSLIIALHIKISSQNIYGMASLNNDWMHLEDQLNYYLKLRTDYEDNFRNIIKAGIINKEILNDNPDVMLFSMLSTLRSLYIWIPKKEDLNQDQLAQSLSKVLIQGISK
ncbi:TetR/AcrR family transcriptional regulator [Lacinutrix iliipiscaria]|uniref:TetR/AcrR family transcriptional regulator n=1 Tax=Lacinutrix iliipiscaria TaxID=1230532 RepID=A0ABW5WSH9_9FLAO